MNNAVRKFTVGCCAVAAVLGVLVAIKLGSVYEAGDAVAWAFCGLYHNSPCADWLYE